MPARKSAPRRDRRVEPHVQRAATRRKIQPGAQTQKNWASARAQSPKDTRPLPLPDSRTSVTRFDAPSRRRQLDRSAGHPDPTWRTHTVRISATGHSSRCCGRDPQIMIGSQVVSTVTPAKHGNDIRSWALDRAHICPETLLFTAAREAPRYCISVLARTPLRPKRHFLYRNTLPPHCPALSATSGVGEA